MDNLNGPVGLIVGAGKGVIRSMHCNADYHAEVIPVDIAINALIAIAWKVGSNMKKYVLLILIFILFHNDIYQYHNFSMTL